MTLVLAVLVVVVGRAAWGVFHKDRNSQNALDKTRAEASKLEQRKSFLEDDIDRLNTVEGVEEEIRETFGYGKEGEQLLVVVPNMAASTTDDLNHGGLWNWLRALFR